MTLTTSPTTRPSSSTTTTSSDLRPSRLPPPKETRTAACVHDAVAGRQQPRRRNLAAVDPRLHHRSTAAIHPLEGRMSLPEQMTDRWQARGCAAGSQQLTFEENG